MRDNQLIGLFLPLIQNGLSSAGFTGVTVKQGNQPTQQGVNSGPTVYFFKIGDHRYGFPGKLSSWNEESTAMVHTEQQQYETSFQVYALVRQSPLTPSQYTASDLVNEVSAIMQNDVTVSSLQSSNVGVLRVTEIRNPYFTDDRDQFEASPSFDFTLTHLQTRVTVDPVIESVNYRIQRV